MTHEEFAHAVERLGMSLEDIAREINAITGQKTKGIDLSRMKKGSAHGGRDPSPVVVMYLHMKNLAHNGGPSTQDEIKAEAARLLRKMLDEVEG